jgi:hypothetical protein
MAMVAVTKATLVVPCTLSGDYVYSSRARVVGTDGGTSREPTATTSGDRWKQRSPRVCRFVIDHGQIA